MKRGYRTLLALFFFVAATGGAQTATRPVQVTWSLSTSTQVTGYALFSASAAAGPFMQIGCTGTVTGSYNGVALNTACASGTTASTATFTDASETVGATVYYQLISVAPACVSGQSIPCGTSAPASASLVIPARPATSVTVTVQAQ